MALKARIKDEMKAALLSGDRFVGETLRNLTAAILDEEVKLGKRDEGLSDEESKKSLPAKSKNATNRLKSTAITTVQIWPNQKSGKLRFCRHICRNS